MKIRLGDFKINEDQRKIVDDILSTTRITENKYVKLFEEETSKFLDVKHVIAVTNGTVALQLVGHYLKHKYGDDLLVCVPALTFPATLNAFHLIGLPVILCDIDESLCKNIDNLSEEQKKKIKIIVPVHLFGYSANMEKIMQEAEKYNWTVIEDFAEAFGSVYKGKKVGGIGDFGCSSFYVSHVLQGGELGIVTTNNDKAAQIMRSMKNHGRVGSQLEFKHDYPGSNYKTTEFCAGLCYAQMKDADAIIKKRQNNVQKIFDGITNSKLKPYPVDMNCSYLGYPILAITQDYKNEISTHLNNKGIETRSIFPCLANQNAYKDFNIGTGKDYPVSNEIEKRGFYIGCHQFLKDSEIDEIIAALNKD